MSTLHDEQPIHHDELAEDEGETAIAEYDYEAQEENELSFPEGAVITNIERVDENWWAGEYQGHSGLFPCNSPLSHPSFGVRFFQPHVVCFVKRAKSSELCQG